MLDEDNRDGLYHPGESDGPCWWANCYTYENIRWLAEKNRETGENLAGHYLIMNHSVLIDVMSHERVGEVVSELFQTGEFERLFVRVDSGARD